jgi:pyruvate ferredoxin oxidoreductase beta subunit
MEEGRLTRARKIKEKIPVENYLKTQKRFRHLFTREEGDKIVKAIQALADENINRFGLQRDE